MNKVDENYEHTQCSKLLPISKPYDEFNQFFTPFNNINNLHPAKFKNMINDDHQKLLITSYFLPWNPNSTQIYCIYQKHKLQQLWNMLMWWKREEKQSVKSSSLIIMYFFFHFPYYQIIIKHSSYNTLFHNLY